MRDPEGEAMGGGLNGDGTDSTRGFDDPIRPGERVGHYEIIRFLGQGGMGVVYRARDERLARHVALKTLRKRYALDPRLQRDILREARIAARLQHANIVPIYDVFEAREQPWIAMQLVEGGSLADRIEREGALPLGEAVSIAAAIADALATAHEQGVLHRDVKPGNILITRRGVPLLADFGISSWLLCQTDQESPSGTAVTETDPRSIPGTPAYMSPEQVAGERLDARSDLFSLGTMLYEMCAGQRPFRGEDRSATRKAVARLDPPPVSSLNRKVPPALERIVSKALAKRREDRYQSAREMHHDLCALELERVPRWKVLARAVLRGAAVVAVALLLRYAFGPRPAPQKTPTASPRQLTTWPGRESRPAVSPDGTLVAFESDRAGNGDIWLVDVRGGEPLRLTDDPAPDRSPAWFPDGRTIAFVSERDGPPGIWRVPTLGGPQVRLIPNASDPAISPDGRTIAFSAVHGEWRRIAIAPLDDLGTVTWLTHDGDGLWDHSLPAWSHDGRTICYAEAKNLCLVPAAGGPVRRLTTDDAADFAPAWSPDDRTVYFASYRGGTLALWRVPADGGEPERVTLGTGNESEPSVSSDGSRLLHSTVDVQIDFVLRDLATGAEAVLAESRLRASPALAPDGSALVYSARGGGGRTDLWVQPLDRGMPSGQARQLTEQAGTVSHASFSPDGRWVVYYRVADGQRDVWIVPAAGGAPIRFTDGPANEFEPSWSPDGRWIAFSSDQGGGNHVWIAPVSAGRPAGPARQLTRGATSDFIPRWSPDARRIAFLGNTAGGQEVYVVEREGDAEPRQLTTGAGGMDLLWSRVRDEIWVLGRWGEERPTIRRLPPAGGPGLPLAPQPRVGESDVSRRFALSDDGRCFVYMQDRVAGNIWVLDASAGAY
jgi:Tol biopolymer transport system component/tRNA A-37 threonylcarbamoyl transferase component Bud32